MPSQARPVGSRPRWPDVVIAGAIVALAVVGVVALFGPTIRSWFQDPPPSASQPAGRGVPGGSAL